MAKGNAVVLVCEEIVKKLAEEEHLIVWDVDYLKEGTEWYLRVLLDKEGGIDVNTLEDFNRKLSVLLDEKDPVTDAYWLEVSSPGLERALTKGWHFDSFVGNEVVVSLYAPKDGRKEFIGALLSKKDGVIKIMDQQAGETEFLEKEVSKVRQYFEF